MTTNAYKNLALMTGISFFIMYGVMFLNMDSGSHFYISLTRLYMSLLMVSPMALLMLLLMGKMYTHKKMNTIIAGASIACFAVALFCLRTQAFIADREYMQAMIPHHSSAIMTSKHAGIKDPEVKRLSDSIIRSQEQEIILMKKILERLDKDSR